jgi:hypothetical protein
MPELKPRGQSLFVDVPGRHVRGASLSKAPDDRTYDSERPVVCTGEMSRQLLKHVSEPIGLRSGRGSCEDHHHKRNGTADLLTFFEPLVCWRTVTMRRRRMVDRAECT